MSQGYASAGTLLRPEFQDWTPTLVNMTKGDGTITARYLWDGTPGSLVTAHFTFTLGSTSTVGTSPTISTPVVAASSYIAVKNWVGGLVIDDSGSETLTGIVRLESTTTFTPVALISSGSHMRQDAITASVPMIWTTGDLMSFTAAYEAAA